MSAPVVCTIGHSNRAIEDFVSLLWSNEIARVIDVRTVPRSRHNPQFNLEALAATPEDVGIDCCGSGPLKAICAGRHPS